MEMQEKSQVKNCCYNHYGYTVEVMITRSFQRKFRQSRLIYGNWYTSYPTAMEGEERGMLEDDVPRESSFEGRLQLKNFMFMGASQDASSTSPRRSQRLSAPQSAVSSQRSASTTLGSPSKSQKRKAQPEAVEADTNALSRKPRNRKATTPSPKKRARPSSSYAPPSTYAHLPTLPDAIAPHMLILTIGLNPGLQTARTGHAYAHPSNLYWKLLYSSGITPVPCKAAEDQTMPARFAIGHTNIVARPSRNGAELSKGEMDDGVATLEEKCRGWRPEVACIVGKSIWESVFRVRHGRALAKGEFKYGWQEERMGVVEKGAKVKGEDGEEAEQEPWEGSRVFVATSTSGLAATVRPEEKERIWKILGDWCVKRRKEREDATKGEAAKDEDGD
ncbi:DNA glycosylase [Hypoxylon sp. FL1150]|nr:DNA glycosylase [Hypoxylon sp. FL1150]